MKNNDKLRVLEVSIHDELIRAINDALTEEDGQGGKKVSSEFEQGICFGIGAASGVVSKAFAEWREKQDGGDV